MATDSVAPEVLLDSGVVVVAACVDDVVAGLVVVLVLVIFVVTFSDVDVAAVVEAVLDLVGDGAALVLIAGAEVVVATAVGLSGKLSATKLV